MQAIARAWCDPKNAHKEMDSDLAIVAADEVIAALQAQQPAAPDRSALDVRMADLVRRLSIYPRTRADELSAQDMREMCREAVVIYDDFRAKAFADAMTGVAFGGPDRNATYEVEVVDGVQRVKPRPASQQSSHIAQRFNKTE